MTTESLRLAGVYSRWPRHRWSPQRTRWQDLALEDYVLALGSALVVFLVPLEISLWLGTGFEILLFGRLTQSAAGQAVFWAVLLVNTWLLDRFLAGSTPEESSFPRWLLTLRRLACVLPYLRLASIPAWRRILDRRPPWSVRSPLAAASLDLDRPPGAWRLALAGRPIFVRLRPEWFFSWILFTEVLAAYTAVEHVVHPEVFEARRRVFMVVCTAVFHVLLASSWAFAFRHRRGILRALALLALLPIPIPLLAFLTGFVAERSDRRHSTLVSSVYRQRHEASRLPSWRRLETALRADSAAPWWGKWWKSLGPLRPGEEGDAELHRRELYRLKTLLLVFEAGAVGWAWSRWAGRAILPPPVLFYLCLGLVGAGLVVSAASVTLRTTGRIRTLQAYARQPFGRYLSLAPSCSISGWYLGALVALGDTSALGQAEVSIGVSGFLVSAVATVVLSLTVGLPRSSELVLVLWTALLLSVALLGVVTFIHPGVAGLNADLLRAIFVVSPVLSLFLGFLSSHWVLRPYRGRDVLDRGQPAARRFGLAFLASTAALPFGGLAIPLWLWVRHRLRLEEGDGEVREVPDQREPAPVQARREA